MLLFLKSNIGEDRVTAHRGKHILFHSIYASFHSIFHLHRSLTDPFPALLNFMNQIL